MEELNVLGGPLETCSTEPLTGFYRDGCCRTGPGDFASHTICAVLTAEFLEYQQSIGNDLSTPIPEYDFPGLKTENGIADLGSERSAWFKDPEGNILAVYQRRASSPS